MLIKNLDETLVNGSIGTVLGFYTAQEVAAMQQSDIDPDAIYQEGKDADVLIKSALSKFEDDLSNIKPNPRSDIKPDLKSSVVKRNQKTYPLVRFISAQSGGFRRIHVIPESWKNEHSSGEIIASRSQIVSA